MPPEKRFRFPMQADPASGIGTARFCPFMLQWINMRSDCNFSQFSPGREKKCGRSIPVFFGCSKQYCEEKRRPQSDYSFKNAEGNSLIFAILGKRRNEAAFRKIPQKLCSAKYSKTLDFWSPLQYNTLEKGHFAVLHHSLMGIDTNILAIQSFTLYIFTIPLWELILLRRNRMVLRGVVGFTIPLWELIPSAPAPDPEPLDRRTTSPFPYGN